MDADRDSAQVNVRQGEITVQGSGTDRFDSARVNSIRVTSKSGDDQSILFQDGLAIAGNLSIADIDSVRFVTGEYSVGSASIVTQESIEFSSFQLRAAGNISLLARNRVTSTETGLLGFLGAVSQASASVRIVDSTLFGVQIDVLAQTSIDANANGDNSEDVQRDFARVRSVGNTEIVVAGRSNINATGNATLQADIVQNVLASAVALPDSTNAARDAALALTNVTSNAILTLTDTISIVASGDLSLLANNAVTITTTADGSLAGAGGKGGVVALAELNGRTAVNLGGSTTIRAANILSKALSTSTLSTTAKSTVGGATANDANTQADLQNNNAQTSAGGMSLAGAYARSQNDLVTEVLVTGTVSLTATRDVLIQADASATVTTTANATGTNNTGDAGNGVGVAIALDRSSNTKDVSIAGVLTVRANTLSAVALSSSGENHTTTATSGTGASNVGGAGAFASNKLSSSTRASLETAATLNSGSTRLKFSADSRPNLVADAKPAGTNSSTAKKGRGASIARNKLTTDTQATIQANASIIGNGDLSLLSTSDETVRTTSVTGAEGGNSLMAGVGMAVIDSNTLAAIDAGGALNLNGPLNIDATRTGNVTTTVDGNVIGEATARGGSFALNDIDAQVSATVDRPVTTNGNINLRTSASGSVVAGAKASIQGTGTAATSDQQTVAEQQAGESDKQAPSADALGKVSGAAASAINLVNVKSTSQVKSAARLTAVGTTSLVSANSTDASSKADSSAVGSGSSSNGTSTGGTEKGRAVAVAINRTTVESNAQADAGSVLSGTNGVTLNANTTVADDTTRNFAAEAVSGAGSRKTGFAGSFALNRVDNSATAQASGAALHVGVAL